jgi:hypothetical protein
MVRRATALSADAELLAAPSGVLDGMVHSVFGSVVNIAGADGSLWCLAAHHVAPGPRAVVVDSASFADAAIEPGLPVRVDGEHVRVGAVLTVSLCDARAWRTRSVSGPVIGSRVAQLAAALAEIGVRGGARPGDDPFSRAVSDRIRDGLRAIEAGVCDGDADAITAAAAGLVGLGTGLTPAGDDVLTGLAYASARLGGPLAIVPGAVDRAAAAGATHAISLTAMHEACRGRAVAPLGDLLAALCADESAAAAAGASIPELTAALVGIGHTSGTDQASGLLAAVRMTEEMRGKRCPQGH